VLDEWITDPIPIHVVYPQNRHLSAKVRVFVEWVAEHFAAHPGMRIRTTPTLLSSQQAA
jgi:LysR family transcriptional regulator for bpeEF and oprC